MSIQSYHTPLKTCTRGKEDIFSSIQRQEQKQAISHSLVEEEWEGCIKEIFETTFIAHLYKKSDVKTEIIEGEFSIYDIPEDERNLIQQGVIFYWSIGTQTSKGGTRVPGGQYLVFRRLPSWKKFNINNPSKIADDFFTAFSQEDRS